MPEELHFDCPLPNGMHARPASALVEVASRFSSAVAIFNSRDGSRADAKSVLSIVAADIRLGDPCTVAINGGDESSAAAALGKFLRDELPHTDDEMPPAEVPAGTPALPPCLRNSSAPRLSAHGAVAGIGRGKVVMVRGMDFTGDWVTARAADATAEESSIRKAVETVTADFDRLLEENRTRTEKGLLQAHRAIARDPELLKSMVDFINIHHRSAAGAVAGAAERFSAMLANSASTVLRERALDVQDVCIKLLRVVAGGHVPEANVRLTSDAVVIAETLTPGQFLALDRTLLKGLVLTRTGPTSHTVILARSFGIPTLTGALARAESGLAGQEVIVDGFLGLLVIHPDEAALRYYRLEELRIAGRREASTRHAAPRGCLRDGRCLEVAANIASAAEARDAFAAGADGIGIFRTEMLFCDRDSAPDEEEQYLAYRTVLEAAGEQPVIIRTLDVGGDKPLAYLKLPHEENPFLGCRGARIYQKFEPLLLTQIRAIVRASAHGPAWLLVPMVATVAEIRRVKASVLAVQAECAAAGTPFDPRMPIGAMVEVPAVAYAMGEFSREVDFFSIGSNDLLQYFMAADRGNPAVAGLYNPLHPPFLRFLKLIADAAKAHGKWIGLCGEMGGDLRCLPLLAGLGLDEISAAAPAVAGIKAELARLTSSACDGLLENAMQCESTEAVEALLASFAGHHPEPLIAPDLIVRDIEAATKEEVIKQAVDLLYVQGRTDRPRELEQAVWTRESAYSTGFGHGFAVPHCKSDAVRANSLAVLRLGQPVEWGSLDGRPVAVVILLTIREAAATREHMRVFAKLARSIMHPDFRERIETETDPAALCAFLTDRLSEQ